jgi:peptide/nickel transport system permease protein
LNNAVAASFRVASAILAEATRSFLELGLVDDPSWGQMLNEAVRSSIFNSWMAVFPGGAIFLTVFAYNLIGESLRDAIEPFLKRTAA